MKKQKKDILQDSNYASILSLTHSILKHIWSNPTVLDNVGEAINPAVPGKPCHHCGGPDRCNKRQAHRYSETQRRSLNEVTFKLNTEEKRRVPKVTGEGTNHREGIKIWKPELACFQRRS